MFAMPDINSEYRKRFLQQLLWNSARDIFDRIADQFSRLAADPNAVYKSLPLPANTGKKMDGIITDMHGDASSNGR